MVEIWWDAEAEGIDEQGNQGKGMMRFSDGGKRYLPGEMPKEDVHAFIEENAPAILDAVPPDEAPPSYPSPAGRRLTRPAGHPGRARPTIAGHG
jgi:hypothetical protein